MKFRFPNETDVRWGIAIVFGIIAIPLFFLTCCNSGKKEFVDIFFDKDSSYTLRSTDAVMFVSDSGITRHKIEAAAWYSFSEATEPYEYFPEKVHYEQFDTLFNVVASFDADTAYRYTKKKLWKFIDNIIAVNLEGEQFETSLLYWDENEAKFYSDRFIRITKGDFVNTGIGFESNQNLTKYRIFNATAEIPINENPPVDTTAIAVSEALPADTTAIAVID